MKVSRKINFAAFCMSVKLFSYMNLRWRCLNMDLTESMRDSMKFFLKGLRVYNFPQNFSASKLLWCTVCHVTTESVVMLRNKVMHR